ncbi:MAG: hypothetical protein FWH12_01125 [Treponema sp.]|nr:hypothetical protein [Treponema sp.]
MKKIWVFSFVFALALGACGGGAVSPDPIVADTEVEGTFAVRRFWAWDMDNKAYQTDARMLAYNSRVEIWAELGSGVSNAQAMAIAREYRLAIYPRMMNTFGWRATENSPDIMQVADQNGDNNGRLTILLLDTGGAAGYFTGANFRRIEAVQILASNSNNTDMLYIDVAGNGYPIGEVGFYETIAHEMQHLINFVSGILLYQWGLRGSSEMDTWLNETLSEGAQYIYSGTYNQDRINWYNQAPYSSSASIRDGTRIIEGNNFYVWGNHLSTTNPYPILDDYSTAYLFAQWLRIHAQPDKNNWPIYLNILLSEHAGYQAVLDEVRWHNMYGAEDTWATVLGDWLAANYIKSPSSLHGYRNQINLIRHHLPGGGITTHSLFPGEGVFSHVTNTYSVPSPNSPISFLGMGATSVMYPGPNLIPLNRALLTYNSDINTAVNASPTSGTVTGQNPSITGPSFSQAEPSFGQGGLNDLDAEVMLRRLGRTPPPVELGDVMVFDHGTAGQGRSAASSAAMDRSRFVRVYVDE